MAIAALAAGIFGLLLSPLLVGFGLGVLGFGLGIAHVAFGRRPRGMALLGSGLSVLAMAASVAAGLWYLKLVADRQSFTSDSFHRHDDEWEHARGVPVPDIRVTTLRGETLQLASLRGRLVVVDFWATWCPPCVKVIPNLNRLAKEHGDDLVIVGITDEPRADVESFMRTHAVGYSLVADVSDESLPEPFSRVESIPTMFFVGRDGLIRAVLVGYHDYGALDAQLLAAGDAGRPGLEAKLQDH
jgi:thiol-disulfide isomerase/thioredoxin